VDSAHSHRRPRKIRRTGRHAQPSQVEKAAAVAAVAARAAPAVAIAGALVAAAPQAHAGQARTVAMVPPATTAGLVRADALVQQSAPADWTYTVRPGDTLSAIAQQFYGNPDDWTWVYQANQSQIQDPNEIFAGQVLTIPAGPPAGTASYVPKHAATTLTSAATTQLSGTLSCSGLEALWEAAGGSPAAAFTAAEIAMAESGGNQYALSPTDDYGYWQINAAAHGAAQATFNPIGNAQAAVAISSDGTNWEPWTTYNTGAYIGRC
jgi:LysM repeat protein